MESVVLLDEAGNASGTADKVAVHHDRTPLHLAFSCYLFDEACQFLLTRRAESKRTFPGVWTNTCCGHPMPGEAMTGSVRGGCGPSSGSTPARLELVLPGSAIRPGWPTGYWKTSSARSTPPTPARLALTGPDPAEVAETRWVDWEDSARAVRTGQQSVSPWCAMQIAELTALGPEPLTGSPADPADAGCRPRPSP